MKGILESGLDEAPEIWDMPFYLLGGAGTHYPRRDRTGKPILPPNALPTSELSDHDLLADFGLNGEWLDSHDVEGYLGEKAFASVAALRFAEKISSTRFASH
ncbi:hypothetical protein N7532_008044 [Penicillium argentinense]|uniref:Uncharacterized protein n=1 Tax=Penicillium argentinense TaxID=1131581 RepID=A0A9W9EWW9_9EURO|nr:uncharacterized protein N7532_008044 [Penicillium argentinense]KAJ5089360.1 hypothetical protein N7532_008044 [Penicillium argentinense]